MGTGVDVGIQSFVFAPEIVCKCNQIMLRFYTYIMHSTYFNNLSHRSPCYHKP